MSDIEVRVLGGFDIRCQEATVGRFESQKARALLAYLATHLGQPMTREHIATLL